MIININSLPFGCDSADCNGAVNLSSPNAISPRFWAARDGIGYWYKDVQYSHTRGQADAMGIPFIAYHVLVPGDDLKSQISSFQNWAGKGCTFYGWDLEVANGCTAGKVSQDTKYVTQAMLDAGYPLMNYSSPGWITEHFVSPVTKLVPDWVNTCWWWLAEYANGILENNYLAVPAGMNSNKILVFQDGDSTPNTYGSVYDSKFVDTDRWLLNFPGTVAPAPIPEPVPAPIIAYQTLHVVNCNGLYVHSRPDCQIADRIGILLKDAPVNVTSRILFGSNIVWKRLEGGYVWQRYMGFTYLQ